MIPIFDLMPEWAEYGYLGIFLLSFLAATIVPFSSDVVMAGMLLMEKWDPVLIVLVASVGNWIGGMTNYVLGYLGKWIWIEKYLRVRKKRVRGFKRWVDRWGSLLAFISWFPGIGDVLAIALGLFKVSLWRVTLFMFIGKSARYVAIAWAILYWGYHPQG
ncbi:MAG: YqaA family protein [Flavobacteriales bacterium]